MRSNNARYNLALIVSHWALALMILISLGFGWSPQYMPKPSNQMRSFLLNLHMSCGIVIAILIVIQFFLRIIVKPPSYPNEFPGWQKILGQTLYILIYVSVVLILTSGYLQAIFSGTTVAFWGAPLPNWGTVDLPTAEFFGSAHRVMAYVLVGLIFAHINILGLNMIKHPGIVSRMLLFGAQEMGETRSPIASKIAQNLAKNLRLFGWIAFWLQLVLALICGGIIGICHVRACIQSCSSRRVRRCYLLGCRWIFALVARNPVGVLLHTRRPQNPRKTQRLFKQNRRDFLLVSISKPAHWLAGSIYRLHWCRFEHIIINSKDRIATARDSDYGSIQNRASP